MKSVRTLNWPYIVIGLLVLCLIGEGVWTWNEHTNAVLYVANAQTQIEQSNNKANQWQTKAVDECATIEGLTTEINAAVARGSVLGLESPLTFVTPEASAQCLALMP